MTTAISTSDPNTERGWGIQTWLLRSTSLRASLPFPCVMTSLAKICSIRRPAIFDLQQGAEKCRNIIIPGRGGYPRARNPGTRTREINRLACVHVGVDGPLRHRMCQAVKLGQRSQGESSE